MPMSDRACGPDAIGHGPRERPQSRALAVHRAERTGDEPGNAQHAAEATENIRFTASECVRRDIRITERDDRDVAVGESAQERERRPRRFLQVIDDHEFQPGHRLRHDPGGYRSARDAHELRRVELVWAQLSHDLQILRLEVGCRDPFRPTALPAELPQFRRRQVVFRCPHHELAQLSAEPAQAAHVGSERLGPAGAGAVVDVTGKQLADIAVLVRAGEQSWRRLPGQLPGVRDNLERERVDGARERTLGWDGEAQREPIAQPGCRRARGAENHEIVRRPAPLQDTIRHQLDDRRRLAGARCADHGGGCRRRQIDNQALRHVHGLRLGGRQRGCNDPCGARKTLDRHDCKAIGIPRQSAGRFGCPLTTNG